MSDLVAASLYSLLVSAVILFQIALALGAPLGHLTMGGRYPGRLPVAVRIAVLIQAALLAATTVIVLSYAQLMFVELRPLADQAIWAVLALTAVATLLNWITPSRAERRLWGPVTSAMLLCCIVLVSQ
ncbi:MAG: hypothetical protein OEW58_11480 [Gammaproteobacteria bacterium]|nr:hypothetical protein [Gammaproteobacteria bacterium]